MRRRAKKFFLLGFSPFRRFLRGANRVHPPGFGGHSVYEIGKFFVREVSRVRMVEKVAASTYNFLMALPPTMLFLFSLIPYLPLENTQLTILRTMRLAIPDDNIYRSFREILLNFMVTEHRDVLSFGLLLTLFFSSNGMMGLMRSFDRTVAVYKQRSSLKRRWTAIKLTFMLMMTVLITLVVFIVQTELLNAWILRTFGSVLYIKLLSGFLLILMIFCAVSIIYRYGPSLSQSFSFVSAGSVFSTLMIVIATTVFFFLVNNIINYNQIYGSIGTLIAFMAWIWLNTFIILVGYELNVSILLGKTFLDEPEDAKAP